MANDVQVKICGITNIGDARAAVAAGADYLGFIFYPPSPRSVAVEAAGAIARALRAEAGAAAPQLVGVFVNETAAAMAAMLDDCGLDLAQLSGDEPPAALFDVDSPLRGRAFKALQPATLAEAEAEAEWYAPPDPARRPSLLLDAYHPSLRGGTGEVSDWAIGAALAARVPGLMLAGGLRAENVAAAVRQVRPFAVDVASGVEASPGRKDHARVRAFIAAAKSTTP